jgi:SAM-dependent methyltransferase
VTGVRCALHQASASSARTAIGFSRAANASIASPSWIGRIAQDTSNDVGCAAGFILQGMCDTGWQGEGIEPNATMAEHARQHLGLSIRNASLEELEQVDRYDVITMIQVMAHFVDPREAFRQIARANKNGGLCLIETWNWRSATARFFGKARHEYSPPSVLHWFSPRRLAQLANDFHYDVVATGRAAKWIGIRHAATLAAHALGNSKVGAAVAKMISVIPRNVRLPYPAEDLFWMLLRKNVD